MKSVLLVSLCLLAWPMAASAREASGPFGSFEVQLADPEGEVPGSPAARLAFIEIYPAIIEDYATGISVRLYDSRLHAMATYFTELKPEFSSGKWTLLLTSFVRVPISENYGEEVTQAIESAAEGELIQLDGLRIHQYLFGKTGGDALGRADLGLEITSDEITLGQDRFQYERVPGGPSSLSCNNALRKRKS